jgi:hypothetical protein
VSASTAASSVTPAGATAEPAPARRWWPLLALLALAATLRFATLDLQSLWYDEAFTPTHVLHGGLGATLRAMVHTENTPPLYYILLWLWTRAFGTGAIALRSLSALAGVAMVPVGWAIGRELGSRRIATVLAAIIAVNPLFVWYSQEARSYILLALFAALSYLFFERARRAPGRGEAATTPLVLWAVSSALALLSHYFAVFVVGPEAALLLWAARLRRAELLAAASVATVGVALLPLIASQDSQRTQWIGQWLLSKRLIAIPQYYVLGASGEPLGHGLLLAGCVLIGGAALLWPRLSRGEQDASLIATGVGATGIVVPLLLALGGADYLAPRNLIGAFVPLTAALAVLVGARGSRRAGAALATAICLAGAAVVIDVDRSPRLQRGDWRGLAKALPTGDPARAIVTPQLGSAPLEYYVPGLRRLATGASVTASEIDLVGYSPIRAGAARPPAPGFHLFAHRSVHGLVIYGFRSGGPHTLGERALRAKRLIAERTQVLVPGA